jgi:DNA-binding MarR family transcriptional regulator
MEENIMPELSDVDRNYNLWLLLHQVSDIIFYAREQELKEYKLPGMQAEVLFAIKAIGDKATPADIARWLFRRPHSVSGILHRMTKAGLIKKSKDLKRKNLIRVTLTKEGENAFAQALKRSSIHKIVSALNEDQKKQLRSLLDMLRNKGLKELGFNSKKVPYPEFKSG